MKEGYKTVEDIIKEVAKEEGLSVREVRDIWKHQKIYIRKKMDTDGVYAIFLPFIGTLTLNVKQFSKEVRGRIRNLYSKILTKVSDIQNHDNYTHRANAHKRVAGVNRLARRIVKDYHTGEEKSKRILRHNKCWDIIEKYSNGVYEKRNTKITKSKK